ncbi:MAG: hypothetical protein JO022_20500 [Acidobacteriaceae bacterium]|nr:hypothetical protein [Acidobacteriaceae bacterium]
MKLVDRIFGYLLILGACGHTAGTLLWLKPMSDLFIWSLGASIAGALCGVLNVVRAGRPDDKTLAVITTVGTACWCLLALAFGLSIGNVLDPRALMHTITSFVLVIFGVRTILGSRAAKQEGRRAVGALSSI